MIGISNIIIFSDNAQNLFFVFLFLSIGYFMLRLNNGCILSKWEKRVHGYNVIDTFGLLIYPKYKKMMRLYVGHICYRIALIMCAYKFIYFYMIRNENKQIKKSANIQLFDIDVFSWSMLVSSIAFIFPLFPFSWRYLTKL